MRPATPGSRAPGSGPSALVLASGSAQRRQILGDLGLVFSVRQTDVSEQERGDVRTVALENARRKALAGAAAGPAGTRELVIGCDTVVATGPELWGKPPTAEAARETLRQLSGATHEVVSGLAVVCEGEVGTAIEVTEVTFHTLDADTLEWYVRLEEWRGRAGGYAIQGRGATLVRRVEGDYLNVVGLPVGALLELCPDLLRDFRAAS